MIKRLLTISLGSLLLTGCSATGPIPAFGHSLTQEWITANFDGAPGDEYISMSNLADIVFNNKGEIIGWYVKNYAGTPFIKKNADGTYNFDALHNQQGIVNLVRGRSALRLEAEGLDPKAEVTFKPPQLTDDKAANRQDAVFEYTQGGVTVTKKVTLHPRSYVMDVQTDVQGLADSEYTLNFPGLAKNDNPRVRATPVGGQPATVQGSGTLNVENIQYAAIQENPSQVAHALIVRPAQGNAANVAMTGGSEANIAVQLSGNAHQLQVFGGRNELIHLHQSGYAQLPGLFEPNLFGRLSLGIVWVMESLYSIFKHWGMVLIALTLLLRLVMWPIMQSQARTTARMQVMQPKIKEIQDRYADKKDRESQMAMQMEMAVLYKEHNFNPAGCLSTFLPLPIIIALWSTIRNFEFDSGFLWLPDLAIPDPFYILPLIYLLVNLGQLYTVTRKTPEMFKQQAIMYLFFIYFALIFPAGVTIYIILSTAIGIVQQLLVNRQIEAEEKARGVVLEKAPAAAAHKKPGKVIDAPKD
ncbi:membrane protein insertase YidC [Deinococcus lacus]|uniref:Membrane protein insertase YidC n=1 Tax=Deinococcus lacus TaxID=392561 RepID=A0ABW1YDJ4_9DEIO